MFSEWCCLKNWNGECGRHPVLTSDLFIRYVRVCACTHMHTHMYSHIYMWAFKLTYSQTFKKEKRILLLYICIYVYIYIWTKVLGVRRLDFKRYKPGHWSAHPPFKYKGSWDRRLCVGTQPRQPSKVQVGQFLYSRTLLKQSNNHTLQRYNTSNYTALK